MSDKIKKIQKVIENISLSEDQIRDILDSRGEDTAIIMGDVSPGEKKSLGQWAYYFYRDTKRVLTKRIEVVDTIRNLFGNVKTEIINLGNAFKTKSKKIAKTTGNVLKIVGKIGAIAYLIFDAFGGQVSDLIKGFPINIQNIKQWAYDLGAKIKEFCIDEIYKKFSFTDMLKGITNFFKNNSFLKLLDTLIVGGVCVVVDVLWIGIDVLKKMIPEWEKYVEYAKTFFKYAGAGARLKISIPNRPFAKEEFIDKSDTWVDNKEASERRGKGLESAIERLTELAKKGDELSAKRLKELQFYKQYNDALIEHGGFKSMPQDVIDALRVDFDKLCFEMGDTMSSLFKQTMSNRLSRNIAGETNDSQNQFNVKNKSVEQSISDIINHGNKILHDNFITNLKSSIIFYKDNFNNFINLFWAPIKEQWKKFEKTSLTYTPTFENIFTTVMGNSDDITDALKIKEGEEIDYYPKIEEEVTERFDNGDKKFSILTSGYTKKVESLERQEQFGDSTQDNIRFYREGINLLHYNGDEYYIQTDRDLKDKFLSLNEYLKSYSDAVDKCELSDLTENILITIQSAELENQKISLLHSDLRRRIIPLVS